jgi:phosphoesterase RecJ-like protein
VAELSELTLNRRSFRALCLWSQALGEMQFDPAGLLWTHVTQAMRKKCGIPEGGESNLSTFLLTAEEVCISALFIERADGNVEMSFRAKPGYDVAAVARGLGGGGHPPAAGAMVSGGLSEVEDLVLAKLRNALEEQRAVGSGQ